MTLYFDLILPCACGLLIATIVGMQGEPGIVQSVYGAGGEPGDDVATIHYCWGLQKNVNGHLLNTAGEQERPMTVYSLGSGIECEKTTQRGIVE